MSPLALKEILKLSVSERVQLAEDIRDSIAADPKSLPVTDAQKRILDRRRDAHSNALGKKSARIWISVDESPDSLPT